MMELIEAIKTRRAYRSLLPVEITEEFVKELGRTVSLAPSCGNNQSWRFVFVYDKEMLERTFPALTKGNKWAEAASMIIAVFSRRDLDCPTKNREYYIFDTGMATAYMILRLADLGLVAHPIAGYNEQTVKEALDIPEDMTVLTLIIVGKLADEINPALSEDQVEREKKRPERLPVEDYVFLNRYQPAD